MKGVILAAGVGSRLKPITDTKPKCLVTVAGKPILEYQLDAYRLAGIKDIIIVIGYKGEQIEKYCQDINDLNINIIKNEDFEHTNNMYSLYLAKSFLIGESFILNNADLVIEKNIVKHMVNSKKEDLVVVDVGVFNDESMKVVCDKYGYIRDISKQITQNQSKGCSIDFYKISQNTSEILFKEISQTIESGNRKDWTEVALQKIFQRSDVQFEILDTSGQKWVEIDNNDDLVLADFYFSQLEKKITDYKCYLFDLDGTLYVGGKNIDEAINAVKLLQERNKIVKFLSNNSSKIKKDYMNKLTSLGISCQEKDIILSTDAAIMFLLEKGTKKIYVLGTKMVQEMFKNQGFELSSEDAEIVVVSYDTELNYDKLVIISRLINRGVDYIATHKDIFCPTEYGPIPDIGTLITMIESTTNVKPLKVFGKPDISMIEHVIQQLDINKSEIVMVGDRLYTDILMAKNFDVDSILVLSGETTREMVEDSEIKPTYILKKFSIE